jgi:hypothetical protein
MRGRRGRGRRGGRGEKLGIWLFGVARLMLVTVYIVELLATVCNSNTRHVGLPGTNRKHIFHTYAL